MADPVAKAFVELVARCEDDELPDYVRLGVRSRAETAAPLLIELLGRAELFEGPAAEHVVNLLAELQVEAAIPPLVDLLWSQPGLSNRAVEAFGARAVPALLAQVDRFPNEVGGVLAVCASGTADPQVREALVRLLATHPWMVAVAAVDFGDRSLVPELVARLEALDPAREGMVDGSTVRELVGAIRELGGDLAQIGRDKIASGEWKGPQIAAMQRVVASLGSPRP